MHKVLAGFQRLLLPCRSHEDRFQHPRHLAFRTASDAPANVTQAANIARLLTIKIGRGIGAGKYDCEVRADLLETLETSIVRCAYGSVSL